MATRYFGQRIQRNEDPRLLTGQALFVDDVALPRMAHIAFVRSPHAHAHIRHIDTQPALKREGVIAAYTAEDLGDYWQPAPVVVPPPPIPNMTFNKRTQPPLAKGKVRFVGEPIVVIVAESRYIAEDAIRDVQIEYELLPPVLDIEHALDADQPLIHNDLPDNLGAHVIQHKGDYETSTQNAHLIIKRRFDYDRGTAAAMENRGIVASWDTRDQQLTIWDTTQAPVPIRNGLAKLLGLGENQVRVIAPFIGGGFGPKVMMFYQEELVVPWVAMRIGRPVKWIEDRAENFVGTSHERGQVHESELALTADGKIIGVKDTFIHDCGAYIPYGLTLPLNTQCTLLGCYDIQHYTTEFKAVFTNKTLVAPYRGAGRQHGVFVMERLLDIAAKELGIDRTEIRRRNLIPSDAFPYHNEIIYQDFAPLVYDSGNYEPSLDKALEMIGYHDFISNIQPQLKAEGRYVGIGVVTYVEGTGIGPYEGARVQVMGNGKVSVVTGIGTQGQGHFTSFAQLVADQLGVEVCDVSVTTGDTNLFYWGAGTFASRGAVVAGNAINEAAKDVRQKILKLAAEKLHVTEEEIELTRGVVHLKHNPNVYIALGDLATQANPLRGAVKPGTEPGLEATNYFGPERGATANGVHAAIVEVDPDTFDVRILRYVVVHDCGNVINPLILDGQIHGGTAQGIGNAFYEKLVYDDQGHLLSISLLDYLLPNAMNIPHIEIGHEVTPSPLNPLGIKGAGEAGAIPVGPVFAQAVEDALSEFGLEIREIPLNPSRLWELVQQAQGKV